MKSTGSPIPDRPTSDDIGTALDRIVESDPFRASPQLVAFLRFVVAATLADRGDRLKGYTIAVEALGRKEDFDPQNDPIVRVEAARLRRALERYYAETGRDDPIVIELPRGSYAPVFHYRGEHPGQPVLTLSLGARPPDRARALPMAAAAVVILGVGIGFVWGLGTPRIAHGPMTAALIKRMSEHPPPAALQAGSGLPVVAVQPFDAVGTPSGPAIALGDLNRKLRDALARFDEIQVASAAAPARSDYKLAATAEYRRDGAVDLTFRLHDTSDGTIAWTRTIADIHRDAPAAAREDIVRQVVTTIAPPYGVIYARERSRLASHPLDPRYRCLLEAFEYWRGFDRAKGPGVRQCLERVTARDPSFADGFAILALLTLRDHYEPESAGGDLTDPALIAAQRAVDLKPQSARAHQALMSALFARGRIDAALAEGEKMIALNPYDTTVLQAQGMRLMLSGRVEPGAALLREAAARSPVRTPKLEFSLFLCDYLLGEDANAAARPRLWTTDDYPLVLAMRALVDAKAGERERAQQAIDRLVTLHPGWRDDPRRQLERYIPAKTIVERLARDLADAGLGAPN